MLRKSNSSVEILTLCFFVSLFCLASFSLAQRQELQLAEPDRFDDDDDGGNGTVSNASSIAKPKDGTFAAIIDRALEKEFTENEQNEGLFLLFFLPLILLRLGFRFQIHESKA